jgi:hypothetical protein
MSTCQFVACDKEITAGRKFCSQTCVNLHRSGAPDFRGKVKIRKCTHCGKEIEIRRNENSDQKTCSPECRQARRYLALKGRPISEEHKRKVSIAHTGKKLSHDHRRKIGLGVRGTRNGFWVDGRSYEKDGDADYNFEFTRVLKEEVRERDEHQCRKCGAIEDNAQLCVHHVDMDKHNNIIENLVTLCFSCHSKIHNGTLENEF